MGAELCHADGETRKEERTERCDEANC